MGSTLCLYILQDVLIIFDDADDVIKDGDDEGTQAAEWRVLPLSWCRALVEFQVIGSDCLGLHAEEPRAGS